MPQAIQMDSRSIIINSINIFFYHMQDTFIVIAIINETNTQIDNIIPFLNTFYNEEKQNEKGYKHHPWKYFSGRDKGHTLAKKGIIKKKKSNQWGLFRLKRSMREKESSERVMWTSCPYTERHITFTPKAHGTIALKLHEEDMRRRF